MNPIVNFRTLASDNSVVALCPNFNDLAVDADKVMNYITKMRELTGGAEVEFNDTFRQICGNRIFYTFEPIENTSDTAFNVTPYVPLVVEAVLLSDYRVALNVNNIIMICYGEEGNALWRTKEDALSAAYDNAFACNSDILDELTAERKCLKEQLRQLSDKIKVRCDFRDQLADAEY